MSEYGPCFECGEMSTFKHHVVPRIAGGHATVDLCGRCHSLVHGKDMLNHRSLTRIGLAAKRARGEMTGGDVPFGYQLAEDGRTLRKDQIEQRVILDITEMRRAGMSLRQIATELEARGIAAKKGSMWSAEQVGRMVGRSTRWDPKQVSRMLGRSDRWRVA